MRLQGHNGVLTVGGVEVGPVSSFALTPEQDAALSEYAGKIAESVAVPPAVVRGTIVSVMRATSLGDLLAAPRRAPVEVALTYRRGPHPIPRTGPRRERKHGGRLPKLSQGPHGRPHWKLCVPRETRRLTWAGNAELTQTGPREYTLRGIIGDTHI